MVEHDPDKPEQYNPPSPEALQTARNSLLELRLSLGIVYDSLPLPDRLIRLLDHAIYLIPGEGVPTEVPYDK